MKIIDFIDIILLVKSIARLSTGRELNMRESEKSAFKVDSWNWNWRSKELESLEGRKTIS